MLVEWTLWQWERGEDFWRLDFFHLPHLSAESSPLARNILPRTHKNMKKYIWTVTLQILGIIWKMEFLHERMKECESVKIPEWLPL